MRLKIRSILIFRTNSTCRICSYSTKATPLATKVSDASGEAAPVSSCPPNTILTGLNYLKDQPPIVALHDDQYPPWLWNLLKPKTYPDDGPGGKGEKMRLRDMNQKRIKEQNFLKTQ